MAISRDGRWVASSSDDAFLLWPMPDLDKPPLHTLPHDDLIGGLGGSKSGLDDILGMARKFF